MELDDVKAQWQALNAKLDEQAALNLPLLQEARARRTRHGLRPLVWGQAIQIALGALLVLVSGSFWFDHRQLPHLLITGLVMHLYGLALVVFGVRMQVLLSRLDFGGPVVPLQAELVRLRRFYVLGGLWIGLPWWVLWIPLLLMAFMGLGVDLYLHAPRLVLIFTGGGIAGWLLSLAVILLAQRRPTLAAKLERAAAGSSLNRAQQALDEIAHFGRD